jgi:hypothetical protein
MDMRSFLFPRAVLRARQGGDDGVPDGRDAKNVRDAERQGGTGAMRESSVGGMVGGAGDTGRTTHGAETTAGAAGDGVPHGGGAARTGAPGPNRGSDARPPAAPDPSDAPAGPDPAENKDFGQRPGDRTYHGGAPLQGEDLPPDTVHDPVQGTHGIEQGRRGRDPEK